MQGDLKADGLLLQGKKLQAKFALWKVGENVETSTAGVLRCPDYKGHMQGRVWCEALESGGLVGLFQIFTKSATSQSARAP